MILKTVLMNRKGLGEHNILEQISSLKHFHKLELRFERFGRGLERSGQYLRTYLSRYCSNHNESARQLIRSTVRLKLSVVNMFHIQLLYNIESLQLCYKGIKHISTHRISRN